MVSVGVSLAHDAAGSVIGLEDDEGTFDDPDSPGDDSDNRYDFDPYGSLQDPEPGNSVSDVEAELPTAAASNPFRYEGFYYDSGIASYDMQAREYRPEVGRFLSQDRFEAAGADLALQSDPLTQNRYAFAGGNPVSNIEWDGHRELGNGGTGPVNTDGRKVGNGNGGYPEGESAPPEATAPLPSSESSSESSTGTSPSGGTPEPGEPAFSPGFGNGPPIPQNAAARKLVKSVFDLQGAQAQYQQKVENLNRIEAEEYAYIEDHKGAGAGELFDAFFGIHNALDVATLIPVTKLGRAGKVGKLFKGADDIADIKRAASAIYAPAKAKAASAVSGARSKLGTAYQKVARRSGRNDLPPEVGVGPYGGGSTPARSTGRDFRAGERDTIDAYGRQTGCHTCGTRDPGTATGHFVPDHQPPTSLAAPGEPQQLFPQCLSCSREQGLAIAGMRRAEAGW